MRSVMFLVGFLVSFRVVCIVLVVTVLCPFLLMQSAQLIVRYALAACMQDKHCLISLRYVTSLNKVL